MKLFNWRTKSRAGSPSTTDGGVETLASHVTDPSAHPGYVRKQDAAPQSEPSRFEEHIARFETEGMTDHAYNYLRRAEVLRTLEQYNVAVSGSGLVDDETNFGKGKGETVTPYMVSAYVLHQVISALSPSAFITSTGETYKTESKSLSVTPSTLNWLYTTVNRCALFIVNEGTPVSGMIQFYVGETADTARPIACIIDSDGTSGQMMSVPVLMANNAKIWIKTTDTETVSRSFTIYEYKLS